MDDAPHPLANWYLVKEMSAHFFDGVTPQDPTAWEQIPKDQIRSYANELLSQHDAALTELGAETTTGIIL